MMLMTANPEKFAAQFNAKVPGAYRRVTARDIRGMSACGLIKRYRYYGRDDIQIVRGILQYEQLREESLQKPQEADKTEPPACKRCGGPLPLLPEGKTGRPRAYCSHCESSRGKDRGRKWRARKKCNRKRNRN